MSVLDAGAIAALVPHAGAMMLLDSVAAWDATSIACRARSHLDPANPLRRDGRLAALCGLEYALQAAALHGALCAGGPAAAGYVASLRDVAWTVERLDDPALDTLDVRATLEHREGGGMLYALELRSAAGAVLVTGRAGIIVPAPAA